MTEATSLGAAIAGGVGVGLFADYTVAHDLVLVTAGEHPNPLTRERYRTLYGLFSHTYTAMEPIFQQLASLAD